MSFVCEFTEADAADIKISHIPVLTPTELAASYDAWSIFWGTRCAHLYWCSCHLCCELRGRIT